MDVEKLRSLTAAELQHQQQELNDQLFRLKFQLKMGQTESLNKIRGLRKDVARTHTVAREKELGLVIESHHPAAAAASDAATAVKPKKATGKGAKRKAKPATAAKSKTAKSKTAKAAKPAKKKAATAKKRKK
jgi:large subunit ribosomal protein L29